MPTRQERIWELRTIIADEESVEDMRDLLAYTHAHLARAEALAKNHDPSNDILDQISAALARVSLRVADAQRVILLFGATDGTVIK
jgi:hypothetical protein